MPWGPITPAPEAQNPMYAVANGIVGVTGGGSSIYVPPTFANVVLLAHFNGSSIVDSSTSAKTLTARGTAALTSSDSVFGGKSLDVPGSGSAVDTPGHTDFQWGTGDFSIEGRVKTTDTSGGLVDYWANTAGSWQLFNEAGKLVWYTASTRLAASKTSINTGAWVSFIAARKSGILMLAVDGLIEVAVPDATNYTFAATKLSIGRQPVGSPSTATDLIGKMDEVRLVKGQSVLAPTFTIPTSAFPDS
jgi:hypothetical protein